MLKGSRRRDEKGEILTLGPAKHAILFTCDPNYLPADGLENPRGQRRSARPFPPKMPHRLDRWAQVHGKKLEVGVCGVD